MTFTFSNAYSATLGNNQKINLGVGRGIYQTFRRRNEHYCVSLAANSRIAAFGVKSFEHYELLNLKVGNYHLIFLIPA